MAIERGDAIRRPMDSTLAIRPIHRGGDRVIQMPSQALAQLRQSSPAIAVVVEQANLGTPEKPLFELLLQLNNQWVRTRSDRSFEPGTVLLVEAARDNEIRVLPNPDPQQLNRMIQASLSFWQAHTLPRVQNTQLPLMPSPQALTQLSNEQPALRPLVQWLSQTPPLNTRTVAQWMQEFLPMPQQQGRPSLPPAPITPTWSSPSSLPTGTTATGSPAATTATPTGVDSAQVTSAMRPLFAAIQSSVLRADSMVARLSESALLRTSPSGPEIAQGPPKALLNSTGQLALPLPATNPTNAAFVARQVALLITQDPLASAPKALQPPSVPMLPATPSTPLLEQAATPSGQWAPLPAVKEHSGRLPLEIRLAQWVNLLNDRISQHPASLQQSLAQKAQNILNTQTETYPTSTQPPAPSTTTGANPTDDRQPLLQLRTLLDAFQGKTQNNAIQQAFGNTSQPDAPPVQQLSIPLIWLGPSAWVNMEWWQERRKESSEKEASERGKRLWRFRLFFELAPLAPLCADLVWEPEQTDITFWSEDQNTLAFLNRHLGTLEEWSEGLGDRRLHTRHGMPKKKSTPHPDTFKPLVDVRT